MNIEEQRRAFEDWIEKEDIFSGNDNDPDVVWAKKFMFKAWRASANREGYKLVLLEPSDHMRCVVRDFDPDIEDYANMDKSEWESLCSDIYKAMIGACDE